MTTRRSQGDGSIYQRHDPKTCPPAVKGVRPEHRCQGLWVSEINMGHVGGKRQRKTLYGKTRAEVGRKLTKAKAEYNAHQLVMNAPTVEQWFTYWLREIAPHSRNGLKPKTLFEYESKTRLYIVPVIGKHRIDKLQPEHIRSVYATMRDRGLSESTQRQTHAVIHRALKVAMREGKVSRNVSELIDAPTTHTAQTVPLPLADAQRVLEQARGSRSESRWFVGLYLGLRQSEALGLRWSNVDLDGSTLYINETTWPKRNGDRGSPKSQAGTRTIWMPPFVAAAMRRRWVDYLHERQEPRYDDQDYVWSQVNGRVTGSKTDWKEWGQLIRAADVPYVPLRAARNTAATLLGATGVHPRLVADILGHSKVSMTFDTYQHGDPAQYQDAMLALEDHIGFHVEDDQPTADLGSLST